MIFWKKLKRPICSSTANVDAVELWFVRWTSKGEYSTSVTEEMEAFTSKEQAESFAQDLRNAYVLLKNDYPFSVSVRSNK